MWPTADMIAFEAGAIAFGTGLPFDPSQSEPWCDGWTTAEADASRLVCVSMPEHQPSPTNGSKANPAESNGLTHDQP